MTRKTGELAYDDAAFAQKQQQQQQQQRECFPAFHQYFLLLLGMWGLIFIVDWF
jgi:hypothetical protein